MNLCNKKRFGTNIPQKNKRQLVFRQGCKSKPATSDLSRILKASISFILPGVAAVLTNGGTVTSDSVLSGNSKAGCPSALIDGIFASTIRFGYCMAHTDPKTTDGYFQIQLVYPSVVQSVLIINRDADPISDAELAAEKRIIGSDLWVGMSVASLKPCLVYPTGSGIYSCGGKVGKFLRLQHTALKAFNIGEIRVYSLTADNLRDKAYTFLPSLPLNSSCENTKSIFDWPSNSTAPITNIYSFTACVQGLLYNNSSVQYQVKFSLLAPRFVHAVTILGHPSHSFADSDNWNLQCVGSGQIDNCGSYVNNADQFGKEIQIGKMLSELRIQSSQALKFFWIGLFTTSTNCKGSVSIFAWSQSITDSSMIIKLDGSTTVEGTIKASLGDCPVAHELTSPISSSNIQYNPDDNKLSISQPFAEDKLDITVAAYSHYGTGVYKMSETYSFTVRLCNYSQNAPSKSFSFEKARQDVQIDLTPITSTAAVNYVPVYSLASSIDAAGSSVNFFTLTGTILKISSHVVKGVYSLIINEQDGQCSKTISIPRQITIVDCAISGFKISPGTKLIELGGSSENLSWVSDPLELSVCGNYTFSQYVLNSENPVKSIVGNEITVLPTSTAGSTTLKFLLKRDNSQIHSAEAQLTVTTVDCAPSGLTLSPQNVSIQYRSNLNAEITWSQENKPTSCGAYSISTDSKEVSLVLLKDAKYSVQSTDAYKFGTPFAVGEHQVAVTLVRANRTEQTATESLKIIVYCPIAFITNKTIVAEVKVGIDIQPFRIPYGVDYLLCNAAATFTISPLEPFLFLESLTASSGHIMIVNATGMMHRVYNFQLSATNVNYASQTIRQDITININGCPATTIERQPIPSIEIFKLATQQSGQIQLREFKHSLASNIGADCGNFSQKLTMAQGVTPPTWISLDSSLIKYDVSSINQAQLFEFNLNVSLKDYPNVEINQRFNITVASSEITCNQLAPKEYNIYDPSATIAISYLNQTFAMMTKLTKVITPFVTREGDKQVSPDFIKYADSHFTIFSNRTEDKGVYEVGLSVGYEEFPTQAVQCKVALTAKYTPEFIGPEIKDQQISCSEQWSFKLPQYTDKEGVAIQLAIDLGSANQYLAYDKSTNTISSDPKKLEGVISKFKIYLNLKDLYSNMQTRSFNLDVNCPVQIVQPVKQRNIKNVPLVPSIKRISNSGLMRVEFSKPIIIPTFSTYPELESQFKCEDSCQRQLQRNETAEMLESIQIINQARILVNGTSQPIIDVSILAGFYSNATQLAFKWECIEFKPSYMDIQLNFSNTEVVSVFTERDLVRLNLYGNQYFKAEDGDIIMPGKTIAIKSIVPQMTKEMAKKVELMSLTIQNTSKAVIALNFILKLLISQSLNTLFKAMNKLQIIAHLLLIHVPISSNAWVFFASLMSLVNFDIIDTEPFTRKIFRYQKDQAFSDTFEELGYVSKFFIINMGTLLYAFFGFLLGLVLILILGKVNYARAQTLRAKLVRMLMWTTFIEYFNESYLTTAVSCFICLPYWTYKPFGQFFSLHLSYAFLIVLIAVPIFRLIYFWQNRPLMNTPAFQEKYLAAYENLRHKQQRWALLEPFLTDLRRITLALALVYSQGFPILQLGIAFLQILFVMIFNTQVVPFAQKSTGRLEQFNELVVSVIFYHMLCFADLVRDPKILIEVGWSMIYCTAACFLINFSIVIYDSGKTVIQRFKLWRHSRKMKFEAERRQRIDEERQKQLFNYYEEQKREEEASPQPVILEVVTRRKMPWWDRQNQEFMNQHVYPTLINARQDHSERIFESDRPLKKSYTEDVGNNRSPDRRRICNLQDLDITLANQSQEVSPRSHWEQRANFFRTDNQPFRTPI